MTIYLLNLNLNIEYHRQREHEHEHEHENYHKHEDEHEDTDHNLWELLIFNFTEGSFTSNVLIITLLARPIRSSELTRTFLEDQ